MFAVGGSAAARRGAAGGALRAAAALALARRSKSSRPPPDRKLYELVTQDVRPCDFQTFMEHTANFIHVRVRHSPLLSYCSTEIGAQNQVVQLWEYDSLEHRLKVSRALQADKQWQRSYVNVVKPMLVSETNQLLIWAHNVDGIDCAIANDLPQTLPEKVLPNVEPRWSDPVGHFRMVEASLPRTVASRNAYLKNVVIRAKKECDECNRPVELYGVWFSAFAGAYNNCFSLWHAKKPDDLLFAGVSSAHDGRWRLDEDPHSFPSYGKLLIPCAFASSYAEWS
eukprot:TRINITY_DN51466_c0_g1_i1.p1 TRINITY_DN51466_c0_g1~~TRINITY_DN51466_c0_g1_i1.p1  ORF type:complete len:305 (+),score=83.78 TRINITY_DN51466_c0_g1_i1:71-916(+)